MTSDGAADEYGLAVVPPAIPRYNIEENSETVPNYTREYLQKLSTAVDTRLRINGDEISYYAMAMTKTQRVHKCLMGVLIIISLLWLVTSIIILVVVFRGQFTERVIRVPSS
ncbi:hypothetical protein F4824DRAFT_516296 [Ustulina deusta]|nr:hypothetical protein F4824DRAFT_516296 [Ustulina deusta]